MVIIYKNIKMCNDFKLKLGQKIKSYRNLKKWTQETLSFESGVSRSHIGHIETGTKNSTFDVLFKISRALNVSFSELFDFDSLEKYQ